VKRAIVIVLSLAFAGVASAATPVRGVTTVACSSGGNLQSAIDAASPGATIDVSGTCHGNFGIMGKDLTIQGSPSATLDGSGSFGATFYAGAAFGDPYHTLTFRNVTVTAGRTRASPSTTGT
jgi:nitrous oxidase accessory protein NosD